MGDTIIILASIVTAIATTVIAFLALNNNELQQNTLTLAKATLELNNTIQKSTDTHQADMKQLKISLAAAQLYAATNPISTILKPEVLKKYRGVVADSL